MDDFGIPKKYRLKLTKAQLREEVLEYFKRCGAEGGKVKSKAKSKAAKANGKKGGRPRGKK